MGLKKFIKSKLVQYDNCSPWPKHYSFRMTKQERQLFDTTVKHAKVYLEFGMGGSTFRALQVSDAKVYSVDSSREWLGKMRRYWLIRYKEMLKRLFLFYVDIGPVGKWGFPMSAEKESFSNYSAAIFQSIRKEAVDTVLIDGRFRVACTLKTILECHSNACLQILIHDFWIRPEYHIVLKYLDTVDQADTLGVFKLKKEIDLKAVQKDYDAYRFDFN